MTMNRLDPKAPLDNPVARAQLNETLNLLAAARGAQGERGPAGADGAAGVDATRDPTPYATGRRAAAQGITFTGDQPVSWDTDDGQQGAWWDVSDPTKIYVPPEAVGKRIMIWCQVRYAANTTSVRLLQVGRYNSAGVLQGTAGSDIRQAVATATWDTLCECLLFTPPVSLGDFFRMAVRQDTGGTINLTGGYYVQVLD